MPRRKTQPPQVTTQAKELETLLTINDIVQVLRLSKPKIYELMAQGLPSLKIDGARRFRPSAVQEWIEKQVS